jgi:DNA-binding NarL/FixJ family response regulator
VVDRQRGTFRIVACDGATLLARGTEMPLATSTQVGRAAAGETFSAHDFRTDPGWSRPIDRVMLALGFRSGCAVAVAIPGTPLCAVLSISSTSVHMDYGRRLARLRTAAPELAAAALPSAAVAVVVVLAEDPVLGEGLVRVVERCGAARTSIYRSLPEVLAVGGEPHLLIADVALAGVARAAAPDSRLLVAPARDTATARRLAAAARADAYVPRSRGVAALAAAVGSLLADVRTAGVAGPPALTRRELDVLEQLDAGLRFKQVALRLGISEATAKWHARAVFRKLGASSRAEAVVAGRRLGLLA